jgi:hypothetical protein
LGVKLLPLAVSGGCVVEIAVEAGVFGITAKSVWASEEIGGHFVNVGSIDLECVAFLAETILVEKVYVSEKHGMPEDLHVLGNDVRVLRKMNHHVDKELVDPHILRDVGAVTVIFERVRVLWCILTRRVMLEFGSGTVLGAWADPFHEQRVLLVRLGSSKGANVEVYLVRNDGERPVAVAAVSSRGGCTVKDAVACTRLLAAVVVEEDNLGRDIVESVSGELGKLPDLFYEYEVIITDAGGEPISHLNR